jgi:hypothetical protein
MWLFATVTLIIFVFLLVRFPKQTLFVIGSIALAGWIWWEKTEGRQRDVDVVVTYDPSGCSTDYPLRVVMTNRSSGVVNAIHWYLTAYAPGRSTDLTNYASYDSDRILNPNTTLTLCYKPPTLKESDFDPASLRWTVESKSITFGD